MGYIYAITDGKNIKIGYSKNPKKRIKQLSTGSSSNLYLLLYFEGDKKLEKQIHNSFKKIRYNGEWLDVTQELLDYLNWQSDIAYIDWDNNGKLRSYIKIKK